MTLMQILTHTPGWVFALLAVLTVLGVYQMQSREKSVPGALIPGAAMAIWSLWSVHSMFPEFPTAMLGWGVGLLAALPIGRVLFRGVAPRDYDPVRRRLVIPGSPLPLVLILGIFLLKYAANVMVAVNPALAHAATLAHGLGAVGGLFGGLFIARLLPVVSLLRQATASSASPTLAA